MRKYFDDVVFKEQYAIKLISLSASDQRNAKKRFQLSIM